MKNLWIVLGLLALTVSIVDAKQNQAHKNQYEDYSEEQIKSVFAQLKNTDAGLEVLTTIQLELANDGVDFVDTSLQLLENLNKNTQATLQSLNTDTNTKRNNCDTQLDEIQNTIKRLTKEIAENSASIPPLQEEAKVKKENIDRLEDETQVRITLIEELDSDNDENRAAYVNSRTNHDDMIRQLSTAKVYIAAIKQNNFLEKSNEKVLAQMEEHTRTTVNMLQKEHHRAMFYYLAEVSNALSNSGNRELVVKVLDLIDELIDYEKNAKQVEFEVEELRSEQYEQDRQNLVDQMTTIGIMIEHLTTDVRNIEKKVKLTGENIEEWQGFLVLKGNENEDTQTSCNNTLEISDRLIKDKRDLLSIINECIGLFQAKAKELKKALGSV